MNTALSFGLFAGHKIKTGCHPAVLSRTAVSPWPPARLSLAADPCTRRPHNYLLTRLRSIIAAAVNEVLCWFTSSSLWTKKVSGKDCLDIFKGEYVLHQRRRSSSSDKNCFRPRLRTRFASLRIFCGLRRNFGAIGCWPSRLGTLTMVQMTIPSIYLYNLVQQTASKVFSSSIVDKTCV